jgi:GNAT superfamily N-acetyltransferase
MAVAGPLVATAELIDAMIDAEIANVRSRLERYAERPGNPCGVYIERFGAATAFVAEAIGVRLYNAVLGFAADTVSHLDAIGDFYRSHGVSEVIEIVPGRLTEADGVELGRCGYALGEFHGGYALRLTGADRERPPRPHVLVERVDPGDRDAFELFLAAHLEGWNADPGDVEALANMRRWRDNDTWQLHLASVDGEPAGTGILDVRGEIGLLASGSTRPAARGRGVQQALIDARVAAAVDAGCRYATAGSYFGNSSMRNLQRAGFATVFVRGIWVRIDH